MGNWYEFTTTSRPLGGVSPQAGIFIEVGGETGLPASFQRSWNLIRESLVI